jgi:putative spermidine/putrescine transport system substrate-binding protein
MVLAACTVGVVGESSASPRPTADAGHAELVAAAAKEGALTTIALARDWCGYGSIIDGFKERYGIEVSELDPNAISADEVEVLRESVEGGGPQAPDVVDLGLTHGPEVREAGLVAPYRVAGWDAIRDEAKDPDGHWWGDYYGVMSFEVNADRVRDVPSDWDDLLRPQYRGLVSLAGDPRTSTQAAAAVYAASLASGGSLDDSGPGMTYFRRLADAGSLSEHAATTKGILDGSTPIAIRWTYNALSDKARAAGAKEGPEIAVVVPGGGRLAVPFVQAISASAPHPSAARLWQEHLLTDEVQTGFLAGGCHPIRFDELAERKAIDPDVLAGLPDVSGASFPTAGQLSAAMTAIESGWEDQVGHPIE